MAEKVNVLIEDRLLEISKRFEFSSLHQRNLKCHVSPLSELFMPHGK